MNQDHLCVDLEIITGAELYKAICKHMKFEEVIELYKRLQYKLEKLEDPIEISDFVKTSVAMYDPNGHCVNAYETSVHC